MMLEEFEDSFGSLSPLKRKRDDDNQQDETNDDDDDGVSNTQASLSTYGTTRSSFSLSPQRNIKNFTSRLFDSKRAKKYVTSFNNTFDMDMMIDNNSGEFVDNDTKLIHEPARVQSLRRVLSNPDDNYCNWNVTERIGDMESTLKILHNSIPQAFDGIISLIDRFLNMKATVNSEYPQNKDIGYSLQRVLEVLEFKKSLYGEVLQQSGLSWKALGFPVEDNWFHAMRQWLFGLAFNCSAIMINEMNKYDHSNADDIRTTKIMENIMSCIKITSCTVELIGSPNNELISSSLILATFYVNLSLSQIDKMENITFTIDSEECQQSLKNVEHFATALVEVGLRLCEHIAKPKINTVT
ncbi:12955_t:CDS:2, partial [Racocetra fulgida]